MIETFSTNRQDKKSYWFSLLALEPVEVKPYISSGDDNVSVYFVSKTLAASKIKLQRIIEIIL